MEAQWLHREGKEKLILFCNGWGMDGEPFRKMLSVEYDVCMFYDYTNLRTVFDLATLLPQYKEVNLVSWSMGVWAGQKLFNDLSGSFRQAIAINGTLAPIHDSLGIPRNIFAATLASFDENARYKFYRRMCREKAVFKVFLSGQPKRTIKSQRDELASLLQQVDETAPEKSIYRTVIVADSDWIFPTANQHSYWSNINIIEISGFHYLFYHWQSWDHLLKSADGSGGIR